MAEEALKRTEGWPEDRVTQMVRAPLYKHARKRHRQSSVDSPLDPWKTLRRKIDGVFSQYIRLRDADSQGICTCISCHRMHPWREMDCGHFMPRECLATRWEPKNCAAQCRYCNRMKEGMRHTFARNLDKKHGAGTSQTMEVRSKMSGVEMRVKASAYLTAWERSLDELVQDKFPEGIP